MTSKATLALLLIWPTCAFSQVTVTEIKIHADPGAHLRPFESITLQVRAYGRAGEEEGRVRRTGAAVKLLDGGGGWISKPFVFQGKDDEKYVDEFQTTFGQIFGQLSGKFVLQDSVLYTAPEQPGKYRVQATLSGLSAVITIDVDPKADPVQPPETISFQPDSLPPDPYRGIAAHYAPFIAQETWFQPKADYLARFDYDGDWKGDNNWKDLDNGTSQAYVYYAADETATHWFLIYNLFHPRDYSDKCVAGTCHENDNEGLILTIAKDGSRYGRLQTVETLAHNNIYSFVADNRVRDGVHGVDGRIELYQNSHPVVFVESGGHGIYGTHSSHARYDIASSGFTSGAGVTYVYKGVAERPRYANDRNVGYQLLPIYDFWWLRNPSGDRTRTFDAYYTYVPAGNRPRAALDPIGGSFRGRYAGVNKAKPFWGWHDIRTRKQGIVATGQWGLDPAYAVSRNLSFPQPFSTTYTFNPYLAVNGARTNARLPAPAFGKPVKSKVYRAALRRTETPINPVPASPAAPSAPSAPIAPIAPSAPEPVLDLTPDLPEFNSGIIEFRLRVDGSVEVSLQGNSLTLNTLSGSPAVNPVFDASQYLPRSLFRSVKLYLRQGRGKARVIERPTAANGYTLRLRIDDPKRGPDDYHVLIEWRR